MCAPSAPLLRPVYRLLERIRPHLIVNVFHGYRLILKGHKMHSMEESANHKAARKFAKILAVVIVLSVAAFGDIMYIMEMQKVFTSDPSLLLFCYLGAFTSFAAVGYLLLGKSVVFSPGGQMLAAWIVFAAELLIIALNIILVFDNTHTGFLGLWAFLSPATPVFHMVGVAMIFF